MNICNTKQLILIQNTYELLLAKAPDKLNNCEFALIDYVNKLGEWIMSQCPLCAAEDVHSECEVECSCAEGEKYKCQ